MGTGPGKHAGLGERAGFGQGAQLAAREGAATAKEQPGARSASCPSLDAMVGAPRRRRHVEHGLGHSVIH